MKSQSEQFEREARDPPAISRNARRTTRRGGWSGVHSGQSVWQARRESLGRDTTAGTSTATDVVGRPHEEVIPVYEEQLRVGKREVSRGSVRVRSYVVEEPAEEQVSLRDERVE